MSWADRRQRAQEFGRALLTLDSRRLDAARAADAAIRRPVSSVRRLDVISLAGGTGCSHSAARVAGILAHRRGSRVLAVDAGSTPVLSRLTRVAAARPGTTTALQPAPDRRTLHAPVVVHSLDETGAGILVGASGLRLVRPTGPVSPVVRPPDWAAAVNPVARYFDIIVTDWGRRSPGIDFETALAGSGAALLVSRADRYGLEQAVGVAAALNRYVPCRVIAVDVAGIGPGAARASRSWSPVDVTYLPFLKAPDMATPPAPARRALVATVAGLMRLVTGEGAA